MRGDSRRDHPYVERFTGDAQLVEQLSAGWIRLWEHSENRQPFYRPEVIAAYLRAFAPRARMSVYVLRSGEEFLALLPLMEERVLMYGLPVRRLRSPSNEHTLRFDLLCHRQENVAAAAGAIWREICKSSFDVLQLEDVPGGGHAHSILDAARAEGLPVDTWRSREVPYLPIQKEPESQFAFATETLKQNTMRRLRKIAREQGQEPRMIRDVSANRDFLDDFYKLEASGWKGKNGTAIACREATRIFYDSIAQTGAAGGYFTLERLMCGDKLLAAQFAFIQPERYFGIKFCYDEGFQHYGPGNLLLNEIFKRCADDGITVFDFMGPKVDYMTKWTSLNHPHDFLYIFNRTWRGRLAHLVKFGLVPRLRLLKALSMRDQ